MTGDRVRLGVPRGNRGSVEYAIVQWVDVDRVALVGDLGNGSEIPTSRGGELTVCQLSTGRCRVVLAPRHRPRHATTSVTA